MSTVSAYLVVITSGLVRDVYQRFVRPNAGTAELRFLSHLTMAIVAGIAILANLKPVAYLQAIVVFSGTSSAATFVVPALMAAYSRRATAAGVIAAMAAGALTMFGLFAAGWISAWYGYDPMIGPATSFRPYYLLGLDPLLWGMLASLIAGIVGSLASAPSDPKLVSRFFDAPVSDQATAEQPVVAVT